MTIPTEIVLPSATLRITHEPTTGDPGRTGQGLVITETGADPDTLTSIALRFRGESHHIFLLWECRSWRQGFAVLFAEDTDTLFVGAGQFSAVVDIGPMRSTYRQRIGEFWSFRNVRDYVLEVGESECSLYHRYGELIGCVPVDPPYEIIEQDREIEFLSPVFGRQTIRFPD